EVIIDFGPYPDLIPIQAALDSLDTTIQDLLKRMETAMIDTTTKKPLHVRVSGERVYLKLPFSQVGEIRPLLDSRGVRYWLSPNVLSVNGGPPTTTIYFHLGSDQATIQAILDTVA